MRRILIVLGLITALTVPAWAIIGKENIVRNGTAMLLPLAPRDPRSLMQGDFMRLDYAMARTIGGEINVDYGLLAAMICLFLIPIFFVTYALQNQLLRGVTFGTIKK